MAGVEQEPTSEMPSEEGAEKNPSDSKNRGIATGATIAGGGCLALGCGGIFLIGSLLIAFGDMISGAQVPGRGQDEIDSSLAGLGGASGLITIGFLAVIGGITYAIYKATKKKG